MSGECYPRQLNRKIRGFKNVNVQKEDMLDTYSEMLRYTKRGLSLFEQSKYEIELIIYLFNSPSSKIRTHLPLDVSVEVSKYSRGPSSQIYPISLNAHKVLWCKV